MTGLLKRSIFGPKLADRALKTNDFDRCGTKTKIAVKTRLLGVRLSLRWELSVRMSLRCWKTVELYYKHFSVLLVLLQRVHDQPCSWVYFLPESGSGFNYRLFLDTERLEALTKTRSL